MRANGSRSSLPTSVRFETPEKSTATPSIAYPSAMNEQAATAGGGNGAIEYAARVSEKLYRSPQRLFPVLLATGDFLHCRSHAKLRQIWVGTGS